MSMKQTVIEMAIAGNRPPVIAARTGLQLSTVYTTISKARRGGAPIPGFDRSAACAVPKPLPREMRFYVEADVSLRLQQRREPHKSLDDFPTPPWATRALCEWLIVQGISLFRDTVREPAANRGHMVQPLREYFGQVEASDIFDYGAGFPQQDYLFGPAPARVDWTITNPPFRLAEQFIQRALETSDQGVAMILRTAFLEGAGRYRTLFRTTPPSDVLQFSERVVMHKGKLAPKGSSATAYCWLVWNRRAAHETRLRWIAPCRKRLERITDYTTQISEDLQ